MALSNTFMEDLRLQMQMDLQALLTHTVSVKEATVVQEFKDSDEIYPCVVIDVTTGSGPSRHVGRPNYDLFHFDIYCLTVRPTLSSHISACSDSINRSGRDLVEYLALKINNYLKTYRPVQFIEAASSLILNTDMEEREGVYKSVVQWEFVI
jgi:hypothetical protein